MDQISSILSRQEGGLRVTEICRQNGISEHTIYRWESDYSGIGRFEVRRLKQLEEENRSLKQIIAGKANQFLSQICRTEFSRGQLNE